MNAEILALQSLVTDAKQKGKLVEIQSPAIADGYEELGQLVIANGQFANVTLKKMSWVSYLIPAHSIIGVRIRDKDEIDEEL